MKAGIRILMAVAMVAAGAPATVGAETIAVDGNVAVRESSVERPGRGVSMGAVEAKFGQPTSKHATVGQPPITRWDYPGFSVFFEGQHVIHAVALGG